MKTGFYIENPCLQPVNEMTACGKNFNCSVCNKQVIDLSGASVADVQKFAETHLSACVILHKRHQRSANLYYQTVNSIERVLWKLGLKRVALVCTVVLLTVSGCYSKRKRQQVTMGFFRSEYNNEVVHSSDITADKPVNR